MGAIWLRVYLPSAAPLLFPDPGTRQDFLDHCCFFTALGNLRYHSLYESASDIANIAGGAVFIPDTRFYDCDILSFDDLLSKVLIFVVSAGTVALRNMREESG